MQAVSSFAYVVTAAISHLETHLFCLHMPTRRLPSAAKKVSSRKAVKGKDTPTLKLCAARVRGGSGVRTSITGITHVMPKQEQQQRARSDLPCLRDRRPGLLDRCSQKNSNRD